MTPEGLEISVNGKRVRIDAVTIHDALGELGYDPEAAGIALAVNREIVPRARWAARRIVEGDAIEIVGAVQGG